MENFHFPHTYYLFVCYSTLYHGASAYTRNSGSLYSLALSSLSSTFFLFFLCLCFLCRSGLWDLCDRWCRVSFTSGGRGGTMVNFGTFWGTSCNQQKKSITNIHFYIFSSATNKMQCYTIYLFLWNARVSGCSSSHHQEFKTVYTASGTLSNLYCYLPLSWERWNSTVAGSSKGLTKYPMLYIQFWAPDGQWQVAVKVWQSTWCCIYSFELLMDSGS